MSLNSFPGADYSLSASLGPFRPLVCRAGGLVSTRCSLRLPCLPASCWVWVPASRRRCPRQVRGLERGRGLVGFLSGSLLASALPLQPHFLSAVPAMARALSKLQEQCFSTPLAPSGCRSLAPGRSPGFPPSPGNHPARDATGRVMWERQYLSPDPTGTCSELVSGPSRLAKIPRGPLCLPPAQWHSAERSSALPPKRTVFQ